MELETFEERYEYLKLGGKFGYETFGPYRYLNQMFYSSQEWGFVRDEVIIRDDGCDLSLPGRDIFGTIYVHHIEPVTPERLLRRDKLLLDPSNLICVTYNTHKAIHYGDKFMLFMAEPVERFPNDTCPWKGGVICPTKV